MVAVSQLPSSEIGLSDLRSGVTCRSDQPPNWAECAVIDMPRRQTSRPMRRSAGSSSFSTSGWERMSRVTGWAPTGDGGGAPAQAAATRRQKPSRGRIAARIVRDPFTTKTESGALKSGGALAAGLGGGGASSAAGATPGLAHDANVLGLFLVEQRGELLHHGAAQLVGVDDGDGATVVARDVVADADGDQLDRRARLDPVDDVAQMALEVVARVHRQDGIVDRRPVGD